LLLEISLTDIAFALAKLDPGRPRETALRRAVSSAYYAVFHSLCRLCADELVGVGGASEDRVAIYRSVDHRAFRAAIDADRKTRRFSSAVLDILARAIALQEQRHRADYDPIPHKFGGRHAVRSLVKLAEATVLDVQGLSPSDRKTLAVALIARRRSG